MTIAVRLYLPDDLSAICDLYNALLVGRVPHCWPVGWINAAGEIEREETRLLEQAVLVALRWRRIRPRRSPGDEQVAEGRDRRDPLLSLPPRERAVGDALLAAAESWMRERDLRRSVVTSGVIRFTPSPTPTCPITLITCRP